MGYTFKLIKKSDIGIIKPLWEKLNALHLENSRHFKGHYRRFTFEERCEKFSGIEEGLIRIEMALDGDTPAGYCVTTIERGAGEIDSLYVEEALRGQGLGGRLVENSLRWLKEHRCEDILIAVAEGNEPAFEFYQKYGFYPRMTLLRKKE